ASPNLREAAMAQGPMDHDRISSVQKALDEHKELTREQFREILRRMDAERARQDEIAAEQRAQIAAILERWDKNAAEQRAAIAAEQVRSDLLHAEARTRHDALVARNERKFDRLTILILTSWLSTLATELYLHLR
ncbi:hypothetical protein, partial [Pseudoduganella sp.]|uniref:hypothetical protein n=1 Tax=Pseudoduganella sp. TaxID=1880898 RepID=UPI0035B49F84